MSFTAKQAKPAAAFHCLTCHRKTVPRSFLCALETNRIRSPKRLSAPTWVRQKRETRQRHTAEQEGNSVELKLQRGRGQVPGAGWAGTGPVGLPGLGQSELLGLRAVTRGHGCKARQ